ncbi:MAG: rane protein of uknown function [Chloroflexi bacterium]|jgi:uncharacterized membrane protein|nr:rane protein of uknown function [Chloroflexota bacterium]
MAYLIVTTYPDMDEAEKVREDISSGEHKGYISLDDSAVIVKDQDGKVHVKNQVDRGVKVGAATGGVLGLLLATVFFPIGGLLLGAAAGGLIGKLFNMGVDKKFVQDVSNELTPGSSALFIIIRDAQPSYAMGVLEKYKGKLYQTNLPSEAEEELRKELEKKS